MDWIQPTVEDNDQPIQRMNSTGFLSARDNLFVMPDHAEVGVVLLFTTVRHFARYCQDRHPLHERERYVHSNYLVFIQQSSYSLEELRPTVY